jgi:hypothetical protein
MTETFNNRVIRLTQNPPDIYYASVFHQFSGRLGPTAISMDEIGNIYVARYETQSNEKDVQGVISVLNKEGCLVGELMIQDYSEINGMLIPRAGINKNTIYFTDKNFNGVLKVKISQFSAEIDKVQDNFKIN